MEIKFLFQFNYLDFLDCEHLPNKWTQCMEVTLSLNIDFGTKIYLAIRFWCSINTRCNIQCEDKTVYVYKSLNKTLYRI